MSSLLAFHPESINYVKSKAKILQKANPGMALSQAQETTATALGYQSWFDCQSRLNGKGQPGRSIHDEKLCRSDFIARRHFQYCALVERGGVAPGFAEVVVRTWGLSSEKSTANYSSLIHPFSEIIDDINAIASGELDWAQDNWDSPPERFGDHIVLGHLGSKHTYYVLDHTAYNQLPAYMRGNAQAYLEYESGLALCLFFEELKNNAEAESAGLSYLINHAPHHYQWYSGELTQDDRMAREPSLASLRLKAEKHPESWFPLSFRTILVESADCSTEGGYIPAIQGEAFARFIETEGGINLREVQWFAFPSDQTHNFMQPIFSNEGSVGPLKLDRLVACRPVFHSPFKHGPFSAIEYSWGIEGAGMRLDEELDYP